MESTMKRYLAEAIGTFAMVFAGTGAMVINHVTDGQVTHVGVSLTWGLIVMAMIYGAGRRLRRRLQPRRHDRFLVVGKTSGPHRRTLPPFATHRRLPRQRRCS